jgi:hypothetical protein
MIGTFDIKPSGDGDGDGDVEISQCTILKILARHIKIDSLHFLLLA